MYRTTYLVTYDICEPKRLREVYLVCRSFGDHIQYSVFRCELTPLTKSRLVAALDAVVNHVEDQVLIVALGPSDGAVDQAFEAVGRPYEKKSARAKIV